MNQTVSYSPEPDLFFEIVKNRVDSYFKESGKKPRANAFFFLKAFLFLAIYITLYLVLLLSDNSLHAFLAMIFMGPMAILIGINVAHDAAHRTISRRKSINSAFLHLFDLLGANSYIWKNRHVFSHHAFPNIIQQDADLKQNPFVRIFPNDILRPIHRYQFLYAPFLYLFYTINWLYIRDFQDLNSREIGSLRFKQHPTSVIVKFALFKAFYIIYILIMPLLFSSLSIGMVFLSYLLMNFSASLFITLALIPSHVAEDSNFPLPNKVGKMANSWSHHQLDTVIDFATGNWFLNFCFGGFNHHVAHHLFPNICHVHYVHITPIVKKTAAEFGLKYNYEPSFINAYTSHYRLLRNNGVKNFESIPT